jgi:hypothetical protein
MALFGAKTFRIEVVDGIDIESHIVLTGDKVTVGTGPQDNLRLGEADVLPAQLTFQRRGEVWDYFVSDRGRTEVSKGHPRAGAVAAGQEFRLGASARLVVKRTDAPVVAGADGKKTIPIAIALPLLALIVLGAFAVTTALRGSDGGGSGGLATTRWFTGAEPLDAALDECLTVVVAGDAMAVTREAPDWAFRAWARAADKAGPDATDARARLLARIDESITEAHFLRDAGQSGAASDVYRRIENAIPLGNRPCPILAATRRDLAVLEMMDRNGN